MRRLSVFFAVMGVVALVRCGGSSSRGHDAGPVGNQMDGGAPDASVDGGDVADAGGGTEGDGGSPDASVDAGEPVDAGAPTDGGDTVPDAGVPGGGSRSACTFNSDCPADERCECDESEGCLCLTGPRGTGRSGVDACVSGNDCESSLCAEGWGGFFCSGPCASNSDCGPQLPLCAYITFIGDMCIRQPDGGS
ncbi:hypothetical protein ACN28S_66060 [Cystobacter fuscus]